MTRAEAERAVLDVLEARKRIGFGNAWITQAGLLFELEKLGHYWSSETLARVTDGLGQRGLIRVSFWRGELRWGFYYALAEEKDVQNQA